MLISFARDDSFHEFGATFHVREGSVTAIKKLM
jgi:hypothetical protein